MHQKTFKFLYAFLLALLGVGVTLTAEEITLTTYYPAPNNEYKGLTTTGETYLAVDSGNVGIGTTSPKGKLDINGSLAVNGDVGTDGQFLKSQGPGLPPEWVNLELFVNVLLPANEDQLGISSNIWTTVRSAVVPQTADRVIAWLVIEKKQVNGEAIAQE